MPEPSNPHHMSDRTIGFSKSDFIHLKKSDYFQQKNRFFLSTKIGFFSSKNQIFFIKKKRISFIKKIGFSQSDFENPIVRSHMQQPKIKNFRGSRVTPQCIKLNLRGLNRHPDSKIDSQISKKMHKIYFLCPRII